MTSLAPFQCDVLSAIQDPLPLCDRPFEQLAATLHTTEESLLDEIRRLKADGFIRRYRPQLRYRALGRTAVLAAATVPEDRLEQIASAVSALPGVSHNYQRTGNLNLWFTLQGQTLVEIDAALDRLRRSTGCMFFSFPAETIYKLNVRFDPAGPGPDCFEPDIRWVSHARAENRTVALTPDEIQAIKAIQQEFPLVPRPFDELLKTAGEQSPVSILKSLSEKGVLDKIAAVLNYPRLGYTANAMLAAAVNSDCIDAIGRDLARIPAITHCYRRIPCSDWPYTLYAMLHADSPDRIAAFARTFCQSRDIPDYKLLPTLREFKKAPVTL